jgi:hypothetical protein
MLIAPIRSAGVVLSHPPHQHGPIDRVGAQQLLRLRASRRDAASSSAWNTSASAIAGILAGATGLQHAAFDFLRTLAEMRMMALISPRC